MQIPRVSRALTLGLLMIFYFSCSLSFASKNPILHGVTAHRGNSWDSPENTIPAFESAIKLGVDWAELDIHRTKDGKLVVIHDKTTGRVGIKT